MSSCLHSVTELETGEAEARLLVAAGWSSAEVMPRSEDDVGGRDAAVVIRVAAELGEAAARAPEHVASVVEAAPC